MRDQDWHLDEGLDPQGPSADDLDRFGDEMTPCASCGRRVYDQAEVCPHCGGFVHARQTTPWWALLVTAVLMLVLLIYLL